MGRKGPLHVPLATIAREPDLRAGLFVTSYQERIDIEAELAAEGLRQEVGLVVATKAQPALMQRDRDEQRPCAPILMPRTHH